MFQLINQER